MTSVNLLYTLFATLTGHLYERKDTRHTLLLQYYLKMRELDVKGSQPLHTLFPTLPQDAQLLLAKILLYTPYVKLGFFGTQPPNPLNDTTQKHSLTEALREQISIRDTILSYTTTRSDNTLLEEARSFLQKNQHLSAFSINSHAIALGKNTKRLLALAAQFIPKDKLPKAAYHTNLLQNCALTTEIAIPSDLLRDIRTSIATHFHCYIPTCVFYTLFYQTTLGSQLVPNIETMGFLLGYVGAKSARYSFVKHFRHDIGRKISDTYDIRYDRVGTLVHTTKDHNHVFNVEDGKYAAFDARKLPRKDNPFRTVRVRREGEETQYAIMRSKGTYLIDHHQVHYQTEFDRIQYQFPYEVRILTPRSSLTRSLKNSAFTRDNHQKRAFERLVDTNPVSKPDLSQRNTPSDNRWQPAFDAYLDALTGNTFDTKKLALALLKDDVFYNKLQPKLKKLHNYLLKNKTSLYDALYNRNLNRVSFEDKNIPYLESLSYRDLYRQCILLWAKNPFALPKKVTVTVKKLQEENNKKARTICKQPVLVALFESLHNRIWQVTIQKMNREMGYPISNYLPGLAVPLYSMERLRDAIQGQDFALCNMDVKSCFDNINLKHPEFLNSLEHSLKVVADSVSPAAASYMRALFKDYLHDNLLVTKKIKFKRSKGKSHKNIPMPKPGALPTGFVLSPALWLTLALPAIVATHKQVTKGTLLAFDLCGDDMLAVAPRDISEEEKEEVCAPWFELANKLSLEFHFFKNYKDKKAMFNPKWEYLFENKTSQNYTSAWIDKFPAYSVPVYHAATVLVNKSYVETLTSIHHDSAEAKLYSALSKRVRDKGANFIPWAMADKMSQHPVLAKPFRGISTSKRLKDQIASKETSSLRSAQQCVMQLFFKGKFQSVNCISKNTYILDEGGDNNPSPKYVPTLKHKEGKRYTSTLCGKPPPKKLPRPEKVVVGKARRCVTVVW